MGMSTCIVQWLCGGDNMYNMLSLITGLVIAVMVALNGRLALQYGNFNAIIIVHVVGVIYAFLLCKLTNKRITIKKNLPLWLYLGGAIGILTIVFNNFAFGKISLTSIVALGLLGQTVASFLIDCIGIWGMKKHSFRKSSIIGFVFSLVGILVMLDDPVETALYAVLLSFCSGITVVLSRTVNAKLSQHIGDLQSSFINHVVGLPIAVAITIAFTKSSHSFIVYKFSPELWIYLGGALGVTTVLLSNITVPKLSAFRLTLLTFVGQIFTGIAIDIFTKSGYSETTLTGGVLVAIGISLNMIYEQFLCYKANKNRKYRESIDNIEKEYQKHLLELANGPFISPPDIVFETRPKNGICCPYCWTIQPSNRNFCYGYKCNAKFVFRDELVEEENRND
jgi:transporter family-2 protein